MINGARTRRPAIRRSPTDRHALLAKQGADVKLSHTPSVHLLWRISADNTPREDAAFAVAIFGVDQQHASFVDG